MLWIDENHHMCSVDMDLGDSLAPAPAPLVAEAAAGINSYEAAKAAEGAPVYIDNPLTRVFSSIIGRRLQQTGADTPTGAAAPSPAQACLPCLLPSPHTVCTGKAARLEASKADMLRT